MLLWLSIDNWMIINGNGPAWFGIWLLWPAAWFIREVRKALIQSSATASSIGITGLLWMMVLIQVWDVHRLERSKLIRSHVGYLPIDKLWHLGPRGRHHANRFREIEVGPSPQDQYSIMRLFKTGSMYTSGPWRIAPPGKKASCLWQLNFLWLLRYPCDEWTFSVVEIENLYTGYWLPDNVICLPVQFACHVDVAW